MRRGRAPAGQAAAGGFGAERRLRRRRSALRAYLGCAAGWRRGSGRPRIPENEIRLEKSRPVGAAFGGYLRVSLWLRTPVL